MPAKFGVHFLPRMINVPKRTKMHLNETSLTNTEICKSQIQLRLGKFAVIQLFVTRE